MGIYYIIIIILLFLGYYLCEYKKSDNNTIVFLAISGAILTTMATLRYSIGFDYFSYESIFNKISDMSFKQVNILYKNIFIGYAYINKIVAIFGGNYITLLLVCNMCMTLIVVWFIYKYSCMPWVSIFLYITFQFFAHSMNIFRQSIAASLFLLAYPFIKERKFVYYLILILIISSIHISGLLLIPLYFIMNMKPNFKSMIIIAIPIIIIYIFDSNIFDVIVKYMNPSFARYKDSVYWQGNSIKYIILPTFYFICVMIFKTKLLKYYNKSNIFINSSYYTFIIYFYITKHFILERFSIYVFLFSIILIPNIINIFNIEQNKFRKNCAIVIVISTGMIYFLFASYEGFHNVYPYISIFQKP